MPYIIDSSTKPPLARQRKHAECYLNRGTELFVVHRTTRERPGGKVSSEWYLLIAAENRADAIECAKAETARHYVERWSHEYTLLEDAEVRNKFRSGK